MLNQPLNNLAPFQVVDENNSLLIKVNRDGVYVSNLTFRDGTTLNSAPVVNGLPSQIDSGTF